MGREQGIAGCHAELRHDGVGREAADIEHDPSRERVAVGMKAGGRNADERIARRQSRVRR